MRASLHRAQAFLRKLESKVLPKTYPKKKVRIIEILDEAALKLFRQWRFKPDTVSHVRIPVWDAQSGRA